MNKFNYNELEYLTIHYYNTNWKEIIIMNIIQIIVLNKTHNINAIGKAGNRNGKVDWRELNSIKRPDETHPSLPLAPNARKYQKQSRDQSQIHIIIMIINNYNINNQQ